MWSVEGGQAVPRGGQVTQQRRREAGGPSSPGVEVGGHTGLVQVRGRADGEFEYSAALMHHFRL